MTATITKLPTADMVDHVAAFMKACGHEPYKSDSWELYWNLCGEEIQELMQADTLEDELDAICDSIWVLIGYGVSRGYDMHKAWAKIAESNLAKIAEDGKVHKRADGKVQKPEGWAPPDLSDCVPSIDASGGKHA